MVTDLLGIFSDSTPASGGVSNWSEPVPVVDSFVRAIVPGCGMGVCAGAGAIVDLEAVVGC